MNFFHSFKSLEMTPSFARTKMWPQASTILLALLMASPSYGTVYIVEDTSNQTVAVIRDQPARFMPDQDAYYDLEVT